MFSYIIVNVLDLFLVVFTAIYIPPIVYKTEIIIIIGLVIFILNTFHYIKANKEKKVRDIKDKDRDYEAEKTRLLIKGLLPDHIDSLGKNPYFKHAYLSGQEHEKKGNYKDAIKSYEEILKYKTVNEEHKVAAYNLIGLSHFELSELEDAMQNFQNALKIIKKVEIKEKKLKGKVVAIDNIGLIFYYLGEWKNAIKNFKYALKLFIKLDNKIGKANSLCHFYYVYHTLNKPKKALKKIKEAIQVYQNALTVYTSKDFPREYYIIQNNLGTSYFTLAMLEDKVENCEKGIHACLNALTVYTSKKDFPKEYATTQYSLGKGYYALSKVKNKVENCEKAVNAYLNALKFFTPKDFPKNYAEIQHILAIAYCTIGEVKDKDKDKDDYYDKAWQAKVNAWNVEGEPFL